MLNWPLRIITQLQLRIGQTRLVHDETGLLLTDAFRNHLTSEGFAVKIVKQASALLQTPGEPMLLLTDLVKLPAFVKARFTVLHFSWADIPVLTERSGILRAIPADELATLLDYLYASNPHRIIRSHELDALRQAAAEEKAVELVRQLAQQIRKLLIQPPTVSTVLAMGDCWGQFSYEATKRRLMSELNELTPQVDRYALRFFQDKGMEQAILSSTMSNPLTIDRVLGYLTRQKHTKVALLCFDAMGVSEWQLLRDYLGSLATGAIVKPILAMLPSLTAISRMALYAGSRDVYDRPSGRREEKKAFGEFFQGHSVHYFTDDDAITPDTLLGFNVVSVLFPFFDSLAHSAHFPSGSTLSKELYYHTVRGSLEQSNVRTVIETLQAGGYTCYLCADHGTAVAKGDGRDLQRYVQEKFGKRGCLVPAGAEDLTDFTRIAVPFVSKFVVIPEGRTLFGNRSVVEINHGGISLDEMVVPLVKLAH